MEVLNQKGNILLPTIVMGMAAGVLIYIGYLRGGHIEGIRWATIMTLRLLPLIFFALIVAGMVQVLIPQELINRWIGPEAGLKGLLLGSLAGGLAPGGPYVSLPIALGLLHSGAGIGTIVSFLTGWSLVAISRLPMEIGILGWKVTFIRLISTFFFPPIAGLIAQTLFGRAGG